MPIFSSTPTESFERGRLPPPPPPASPPSYPESVQSWDQRSKNLDPWLGLRARLFLSLISYGIVSLIFVGTRIIISSSQVDNEVQRSNDTLWNACRDTEQAASTLASFPHLLADNFNSATKRSVDDTVQGLGKILMLGITAIESLLVFLVDMYRSLFLCFIQFVVQASLSLIISAVQLFSGVVHDTAQSIQATIQGSIDALNATLATTLGGINDILKIVGQHVTVPVISQPNLSALNNVTLPSTFQDSLIALNNSLPTLADLKTKMDTLIQTPFEDLKQEVNTTITNFSFNQSALPVPQMQSITYCNDTLNTQALEDLGNDLRRVGNIGIGILVLLGFLFLAFNLFRECYSWHSLKKHVAHTREAFLLSDHAEKGSDNLDHRSLLSLLQLSTHPLLAEWGLRWAERVGISSKEGKARLRWWMAWISHPVGLLLLVMGLLGVMSVEIQISAINRLGHHYKGRFEHMLDSSVMGLQDRLDATLLEISTDYANKTNTVILQAQNDLNDHLFQWVNVTTSTMNNTLNEFMDGIATAINDTFANTPLYSPVQTFIDCVLGQKVVGIESALTWMQSHAQATFSTVPVDFLMISPNTTQEVVKPVEDTTLGSSGILSNLIGTYTKALEKERCMFIVLLLLYLILFIIGSAIALLNLRRKREKNNQQAPMEDLYPPPLGFTTFDRSASPGIGSSHRSISKPMHPDVISLYHHNHSQQHQVYPSQISTSGLRNVVNQPCSLSSCESLLDTRRKASSDEADGNSKKLSWIRVAKIKSASVDSAYSPMQRGSSKCSSKRNSRNTVQEREDEEDERFDDSKWRITVATSHDPFSHIPAPMPSTAASESIRDSSYPTSCDSYFNSRASSLSQDDISLNRSNLCPPQPIGRVDSQNGGLRNVHLSDISERPEGSEGEEVLVFDGASRSSPPRSSFLIQTQDQEVPLHRTTLDSIGRTGQAI